MHASRQRGEAADRAALGNGPMCLQRGRGGYGRLARIEPQWLLVPEPNTSCGKSGCEIRVQQGYGSLR